MKVHKLIYFLATFWLCILLVYLLYPIKPFPNKLPDSLQSTEPGDVESKLRRSYFTNFAREEVINFYRNQFTELPTQRLNYPPEDAQTIIRDQTRSSYLEEINQPFRFSLYINGFVPKEAKDNILIEGKDYYQKITVRYVPTNLVTRLAFFAFTTAFTYLLLYAIRWQRK